MAVESVRMYVIRPTWPSGVSAPSYRRWAIDIVRFGLKPSLRLASCWSVEVVNGGAGWRFWVRVPVFVTRGCESRSAVAWRSAVSASATFSCSPSMRTSSAAKRSPCRRRQDRLERPVLAGDERADLALPLDDEPHGDGLDAAGRQAAPDLARQERAEGVADETVDDSSRLLRIDQVLVDAPRVRERFADRRFGDLAEGDAARLVARDMGGLRDVPRDGLAFAVEVGGQVDGIGPLGRPLDLGDLLAPVVGHDVLGLEVMVDVDAELALAGVLRKVTDVAVGGQDTVVRAEVALDRSRLCRRFHDHKVLWHGRESSTARCTDGSTMEGDGIRRRTSLALRDHIHALSRSPASPHGSSPVSSSACLGVADPAEEVLVDLEVLLGTVLRDACLDGYALFSPAQAPDARRPALQGGFR